MRQSLEQAVNIRYVADPSQFSFFFTDSLKETLGKLNRAIGNDIDITAYPDATLKTNLLPTGVVFRSRAEDAMLLPFVLRDPGCGYTLFKFEFTETPSSTWKQDLGQFFDEIITQQKLIGDKKAGASLLEAINLTSEEKERLQHEFLKLTNTFEIRQPINIQQPQVLADFQIAPADMVGFLHSGSHVFPQILMERFIDRIFDYAEEHRLFHLEDMKKGIVGVPYNSALGREYAAWVKCAMQYTAASRQAIFHSLKQMVENNFPCKMTFLNDKKHAGIFDGFENNAAIMYMTRGTQVISSGLNLIAGQRETIAALVTPGSNADEYNNMLAHGTGYHIRENHNYDAEFNPGEVEYFIDLAHHTYYNTTAKFNECIPYTHNILASLKHFEKIGLVNLVAWLAPLINIHSNFLKDNHDLITGVQ